MRRKKRVSKPKLVLGRPRGKSDAELREFANKLYRKLTGKQPSDNKERK